MATKTRPLPTHLGEVRIPGKFLYCLDELFASLHNRIVNKAAVHAFARKRGRDAGVVTPADLVQAAEELFASAPIDLREILTPGETTHVRRKTA